MSKPRSAEARRRARETFRQRYRRFDYTPGVAALAAIERMQAERPAESLRRVIDALVVAGEAYCRQSK